MDENFVFSCRFVFFPLLAFHPFHPLLFSLLPVSREGGRGREREDGMEKQDGIEMK
jgi:hypothetical protein